MITPISENASMTGWCGSTSLRSDGPSSTPASSSPITAAWPMRSKRSPSSLASASIAASTSSRDEIDVAVEAGSRLGSISEPVLSTTATSSATGVGR